MNRPFVTTLLALAQHKCHKDAAPVGSTYILGKPGADIDVLWLASSRDEAKAALVADGFYLESSEAYADTPFQSFRNAAINVIVTEDPVFFRGFVRAAEACKYLKVTDKDQRKALHRIIRDGLEAAEA